MGAADTVVKAVESWIARDELPTRFRLGTKGELAARYEVAPATLGEALRVLRARGVIEVRPGPGGGVFVAEQAPLFRLARQVLALRDNGATANDGLAVLDALDAVVIRDAATHRRPRDLRDLDRLGRQLTRAWADPMAGPQANWQLHRRIAAISPNPIVRAFYENLVDYLGAELDDPAVAAAGFEPLSARRLRLHLDIIEAIRTGEARAVREVIRRHADPTG